ncbi:hypothetical protein AQUCO_00400307v1 [Aquilegia coerulea]|uniref:Uncharacterized protein n=1 Tax=Aquilegia coerulea TaxID=218851 RepID=A0A2G5EU86_AQUCA|nr:hypothetical protein AQUCO_00400307v1 [Aquilegia coerulea]
MKYGVLFHKNKILQQGSLFTYLWKEKLQNLCKVYCLCFIRTNFATRSTDHLSLQEETHDQNTKEKATELWHGLMSKWSNSNNN